MRDLLGSLDTKAKVLPILAVLAFFISLSASSSSTVNGEVTSCSHFDVFALGVAVICLVGGALLGWYAVRPRNPDDRSVRPWHAVLGIALVLVSVVHAVRAFGIIGGPCN
ncbi:hypothetical protein [Nocardioides sp. AE5]|uniref:hypothetical protein n=1 Tax=Nocardioides sp. AE5 TaxID=2962573 RepID=UPI002882C68D|nr:hypothetical protein [Nocardioides sp. AE5]MDT0200315.1 hypothetical protein [Nocardioides sp. AE5]